MRGHMMCLGEVNDGPRRGRIRMPRPAAGPETFACLCGRTIQAGDQRIVATSPSGRFVAFVNPDVALPPDWWGAS